MEGDQRDPCLIETPPGELPAIWELTVALPKKSACEGRILKGSGCSQYLFAYQLMAVMLLLRRKSYSVTIYSQYIQYISTRVDSSCFSRWCYQ
jgi:hypothetical protein